MASYSYLCHIDDLGRVIDRMKKLAVGMEVTFHYDLQLVRELSLPKWARIKWFYYCDQQEGNTIRLYDREFFQGFRHLYKEPRTCVILRGNDLGKTSGDVKAAVRRLLGPLEKPPPGVNTNPENYDNCIRFFGQRNACTKETDRG